MKNILSGIFATVVLASALPSFAQDSGANGFKLMQAGNYQAALPLLKAASAASPRDRGVTFYYGKCAAQVGDSNAAIAAFSRLYVMCGMADNYTVAADQIMHRLRGSVRPYSCLFGNTLLRWDTASMPIKIYVTEGRSLPVGLAGTLVSSDAIEKYGIYLRSPKYLQSLPRVAGANPSSVRSGLGSWQFLTTERILTFQLVQDPSYADVIVFFADKLAGNKSGYTTYPPSAGSSFPIRSVAGQPVVIQISSGTGVPVAAVAAHEFGHAFGLQHSRSGSDIMTENNRSTAVSESDRLSIRALYQLTPDVWLHSVSK